MGKISDVSFENFTCYPVLTPRAGVGGTKARPRAALRLESYMDHVHISNFKYLCDEEGMKICPAVKAYNLCGETICADGKEYFLAGKDDVVVLENFRDISFRKGK